MDGNHDVFYGTSVESTTLPFAFMTVAVVAIQSKTRKRSQISDTGYKSIVGKIAYLTRLACLALCRAQTNDQPAFDHGHGGRRAVSPALQGVDRNTCPPFSPTNTLLSCLHRRRYSAS